MRFVTWVDLAVVGVLVLSGIVAFARGFVREILGIGAWVASAFVSVWAFPSLNPKMRQWIGEPDLADPATFLAAFLIAIFFLTILTRWVAGLVSMSALGGLDRSLGLVFGIVRGAALVIVAYIAAGMVVAVDRWPEPVLDARLLPVTYRGAEWLVDQVPPAYRPRLQAPPPGHQTTAAELLHATPQGRATARPAGN